MNADILALEDCSDHTADPAHEGGLRPPIADSWRRSSACGVPQEKRPELPYNADFDADTRLLRAAGPVLDRLIGTLSGTHTSVILADRDARIVRRWVAENSLYRALDRADAAPGFMFAEEFVGTNGVGTVLEAFSPMAVRGEEHYADFLRHLSCVGVPIHHPLTRKIEGVLDITTLATDYHELMAPLLVEAVRHIEHRMTQMSAAHELALLEEFTRTSRRYPGAVVGVSSGVILSNPAAAEHLEPFDHPVLWDFARKQCSVGRTEGVVALAQGSCKVACLPVTGGRNPTFVLRLEFVEPRAKRPRRPDEPAHAARTSAQGALPGRSPQWKQVLARLHALAGGGLPVAIIGEAGVGKLALATHLHRISASPDRTHRLQVLDVSTLTESARLQLVDRVTDAVAEGYTVVLRRINGLPDSVLSALRTLPDIHGIDAGASGRLIVTVGTSPETADSVGQAATHFAHQIWVPPLDQRSEDIADLVPSILAELGHGTSPPRCSIPALQLLLRCGWPGNVAELKEALIAAVAASSGGEIHPHHLPSWVQKRSSGRRLTALQASERNVIMATLASVDNNRTEAAKILGIGRATLYRRMRSLGIPTGQEFTS